MRTPDRSRRTASCRGSRSPAPRTARHGTSRRSRRTGHRRSSLAKCRIAAPIVPRRSGAGAGSCAATGAARAAATASVRVVLRMIGSFPCTVVRQPARFRLTRPRARSSASGSACAHGIPRSRRRTTTARPRPDSMSGPVARRAARHTASAGRYQQVDEEGGRGHAELLATRRLREGALPAGRYHLQAVPAPADDGAADPDGGVKVLTTQCA